MDRRRAGARGTALGRQHHGSGRRQRLRPVSGRGRTAGPSAQVRHGADVQPAVSASANHKRTSPTRRSASPSRSTPFSRSTTLVTETGHQLTGADARRQFTVQHDGDGVVALDLATDESVANQRQAILADGFPSHPVAVAEHHPRPLTSWLGPHRAAATGRSCSRPGGRRGVPDRPGRRTRGRLTSPTGAPSARSRIHPHHRARPAEVAEGGAGVGRSGPMRPLAASYFDPEAPRARVESSDSRHDSGQVRELGRDGVGRRFGRQQAGRRGFGEEPGDVAERLTCTRAR